MASDEDYVYNGKVQLGLRSREDINTVDTRSYVKTPCRTVKMTYYAEL
jgi:hypothetical protein